MKIYDISQEVLTCEVYPGDPKPKLTVLRSFESGDVYNLSEFTMSAHNGTHIDAPSHFINGGKSIGEIDLSKVVGEAYVVEMSGNIGPIEVSTILSSIKNVSSEASRRILIKGNATLTDGGAMALCNHGVLLVGTESQSVGPIDAPMTVHKILLENDVVILEGVRLSDVDEGMFILSAAPLNLASSEGSPCRAILIKM